MDAAVEHPRRHGAADQRRRDVVQEGREHEHHDQQDETALPVVRQVAGQDVGNAAVLEVAGQDGETQQQAQQVGDGHPFVHQVAAQAGEARHAVEIAEAQLVQGDGGKPDQGHPQRVMVEQGHAQQGQGEQDEVHGDAEHGGTLPGPGRGGKRQQDDCGGQRAERRMRGR
jgi:hypothetical protein